MLETEKIKLKLSTTNNLPLIIQIEKENSDFVDQYDLDRHKKVIADKNELHLSIFDKSDNSLVGYILLAGFSELNDSIEFRRIVISRKGSGFGRDAIKLTKDLCFKHYNMHRLWLDVFPENKRAIRLYEAQGFKKEGLLRDCLKRGKDYQSLWVMSILSSEFNSW